MFNRKVPCVENLQWVDRISAAECTFQLPWMLRIYVFRWWKYHFATLSSLQVTWDKRIPCHSEMGNYYIRPYVSSIQHKNSTTYRLLAQFISNGLEQTNLGSLYLIPGSSQIIKVTLWAAHAGLICWMNERYACTRYSLSPYHATIIMNATAWGIKMSACSAIFCWL